MKKSEYKQIIVNGSFFPNNHLFRLYFRTRCIWYYVQRIRLLWIKHQSSKLYLFSCENPHSFLKLLKTKFGKIVEESAWNCGDWTISVWLTSLLYRITPILGMKWCNRPRSKEKADVTCKIEKYEFLIEGFSSWK